MKFPLTKPLDALNKNKRMWLSLGFLVLLVGFFWSSSRYPQLNEKALMGGETPTTGISFDALFNVDKSDPVYIQILYNTVNWIDTNKKGMSFGILFATLMILVFSLIDNLQLKNRFGNSLIGLLIGAPLGVCTNCAAPIAKGMYDAGGQRETVLATMTSSPTLNIVVLGMLFSLFPFYLALLKVVFSVVFILIGIPLITYVFKAKKDVQLDCPIPKKSMFDHTGKTIEHANLDDSSWFKAFSWTVKSFFVALWHIIKTTVPLMLLAGFLGSVFITIIPWEQFYQLFPFTSPMQALGAMILLSIIGTFLPVPIAFDVIIVAILINGGLPIPYASVLLFTLGIFSIYSFLITKQTMNIKLAIATFVLVACFGVLAGVTSNYFQIANDRVLSKNFQSFKESNAIPTSISYQTKPINESNLALREDAIVQNHIYTKGNISINSKKFNASDINPEGRQIEVINGSTMGLGNKFVFNARSMIGPYILGNAIASGDIDQDGYTDILNTSDGMLTIYYNNSGQYFSKVPFDLFQDEFIYTIALVDINNDSWLDLFISTYRNGNFIVYSEKGQFLERSKVKLPQPPDLILTTSPGFSDVDKDGDLDIFLGNWSIGFFTKSLPETKEAWHSKAKSCLLINTGNDFKVKYLEGVPGETLTSLFVDLNDDGNIDLIEGNDHAASDHYYLGDGLGNFNLIERKDNKIPETTTTTMNITSVDLDNDLKQEVFLNDAFSRENQATNRPEKICSALTNLKEREYCEKAFKAQQSIQTARSPNGSYTCPDSLFYDCLAVKLLFAITEFGQKLSSHKEFCDYYSDDWQEFKFICENSNPEQLQKLSQKDQDTSIPQKRGSTLLQTTTNGKYKNIAQEYGLSNVGWSWNAKFMDLDHDEYQDLYVVNGFNWKRSQESNYFFKNMQGKGFKNITFDSELDNFLPIHAYTYIDFDNDGDMDIVSAAPIGPMFVYKNKNTSGNSMMFDIQDHQGNRASIGTKIIIHYGDNGQSHQMREITASGGFKSFDAPQVHFGIGQHDKIQRLEVHWSTGEKTILDIELGAGYRYTIQRNNDSIALNQKK